MQEYENLIEVLVKMSEISRPLPNPTADKNQQKQDRIQHGICDLLEDAAVAIDELVKRVKQDERQAEAA